MPKLDHTGPEGKGSKTGRKLGKCHKNETELKETGEPETGQGKRHHAKNSNVQGKSKRKNYLKTLFKKGG